MRSLLFKRFATAAIFFIAVRGVIGLIVGDVFGQTMPHMPLYLAEALCVKRSFAPGVCPLSYPRGPSIATPPFHHGRS